MNSAGPLKVIAKIRSNFPTKFGIPRQSGLVEILKSTIVFEPEYRNPEAIRGLEQFSHIWLIWEFSEAKRETWSPTVRPPRLGGNAHRGVFATRSPYRPNAIGLSSVKLDGIELDPELGHVLHISGADLMDGTPIFDIKPYLPSTDCHSNAIDNFDNSAVKINLRVEVPNELKDNIEAPLLKTLCDVLALDPRPAYHKDPTRIYGFEFAGYEIKFCVNNDVLYVTAIALIQGDSK